MPTIPWSWFNELQVNGFCHTTRPACDPSGNTITKTESNCYLLFCSSVTRVTIQSRMAHDSRLNYPLLVIFTCKCKLLDHAKLFSSQYDFWIPNILTIKNILSCPRVPKADQNITKDFLVAKSWLLMVVRDCMSSLMNFLIKIERTDNSKLFFNDFLKTCVLNCILYLFDVIITWMKYWVQRVSYFRTESTFLLESITQSYTGKHDYTEIN